MKPDEKRRSISRKGGGPCSYRATLFAFQLGCRKSRTGFRRIRSPLIKTGKGIDPVLQENKAVNIGNTIHWLVLHSPLDVMEFHSHSDALAPDHEKREPFSSGTSVSYNYIDYRFRNNTDRDIQLLL